MFTTQFEGYFINFKHFLENGYNRVLTSIFLQFSLIVFLSFNSFKQYFILILSKYF